MIGMLWTRAMEFGMGLYENIHKKRKRIEAGSGEKMKKVGQKGRPTTKHFYSAKKTKKKTT